MVSTLDLVTSVDCHIWGTHFEHAAQVAAQSRIDEAEPSPAPPDQEDAPRPKATPTRYPGVQSAMEAIQSRVQDQCTKAPAVPSDTVETLTFDCQRLVDDRPAPANFPVWGSMLDDFWTLEEEADGGGALYGELLMSRVGLLWTRCHASQLHLAYRLDSALVQMPQ